MSQQQENTTSDNTMILMWVLGLVCIIILWLVFHRQITTVLLTLRRIELTLPALVSEEARLVGQRIAATKFAAVEFNGLLAAMGDSGRYVRYIYLPFIAAGTWWLWRRDTLWQFRKKYTMRTLIEQEQKIWPTISPATKLKINETSMTRGEWACSMTEREFAKAHNLLDEKGKLIQEKADVVFAKQLGLRFTSVDAMPSHMQAVFCCLAARVIGEKAEAERLSNKMAVAYQPGKKIDFSWAKKEVKKYVDHALIQESIRRHAYIYTLLATLMQLTRVANAPGVFASSQFKWLRTVDRTLWYTINNVGRASAFHAECAGVMCHWQSEKAVGRRIVIPCIKEATSFVMEVADNKGKKGKRLMGGLALELENYIDEDEQKVLFK